MSEPLGDRASALQPFLRVQRLTEQELARQLNAAARDVRTALRRLETAPGVGAAARRAQYRVVLGEIADMQQQFWGTGVRSTVEWGKRRAIDAAADAVADLEAIYVASEIPIGRATLRNAARAQARQGLTNVLSRSTNGISLSERVYRQAALASGRIGRIVDSGLIGGKSAREIANDVYKFIIPSTPGGASYAAMRLGRTELNNAFHTTTVKTWGASPFVETLTWNLSGSHPEPDECDSLKAGGPYRPTQVPSKPHPQCFCYLTANVMSEDEMVERFRRGYFDDYLDEQAQAAERGYPETDRQRALALTQRRVYADGRRAVQITDLPASQRAGFLTAEERDLLRASGFAG